MPQSVKAGPEKKPERPPKKGKGLYVRIDDELLNAASQKAESRGWSLGAVIRALLAYWIDEELLSPEDVGKHSRHAAKPGRPRKPK